MEFAKSPMKAIKCGSKKLWVAKSAHDGSSFNIPLEFSPDAVIVHSNGRIIHANSTALRYMQIDNLYEFTKIGFMELIHPDYHQAVEARLESITEVGKYIPFADIKLVRPNGSIMDVQVASTKILYKDNQVYLSTIRDISERKSIETALLESEERYRKVVELSPDAIFVSCNNKMLLANDAAAKLTGMCCPDVIIGRKSSEVLAHHPDYEKTISERLKQIYELGITAPMIEQKLIRADGTEIDVEVTAAPFTYKGQNGMLVIARDITTRKKAADEINLKAALLDAATDSIILHDYSGNFLYVNEATCRLYGYTKEEMLNMNLRDINPPEYAELTHFRLDEIAEKGILIFEVPNMRKDKTVFPMEVHVRTIEAQGRRLMFSVARDISERKDAEELHIKNEENLKLLNAALQYDRMKTEFFSNISHELRTPLNVILGTVQLFDLYFKSGLISSGEQSLDRHIKGMKQNCYRLLRLLNNLIDLTKIDSGYLQLNPQKCNIVNIIEDITQSVVEFAKVHGITLLFDTDVEEKVIMCDIDKIERIVLNLLSNAIKFTDSGGTIIVGIQDKGNIISLSVKDTGIGIPQDKHELIFERFRQVDASLNREHEGSGIGLSIVKSLVEMHNGNISVKSEPGIGSEFIVELPVGLVNDYNISSSSSLGKYNVQRIFVELPDIYDQS